MPGKVCAWRKRRLQQCVLRDEREKMNINFTDIHGAADYIGPGAIEVPMYQSEITDLVRRRGMFGQRIKQVPATGHPARYFERRRFPLPQRAAASSIRATL